MLTGQHDFALPRNVPMRSRPTLSDVAKVAGVSIGSASKALSDPAAVRAKTLSAVRMAADALGYIPNDSGRALATRRSLMVGVVLPTIDNPVYAAFVHALQKALIAHGYQLVALAHEYDRVAEDASIARLVRRGVDAVILIGTDHGTATTNLLERTRTPHLFCWSSDEAPPHRAIGFSNRAAMAAIVGHLVELGHRRIAVLGGEIKHNERARARLAGVGDAVVDGMLAAAVTVPLTIAGGRAGFAQVRAAAPDATALVCMTDTIAAGALAAAREAGVRVPADMSITGFDDIDLAAVVSPGLTTVRVPIADLAAHTGAAIVAMLAGGAAPRSLVLPTQLVIRASTAPPPELSTVSSHASGG